MGELWLSRRATKPSKKSNTAARIISPKASVRLPQTNAATAATEPQSRFERVSRLGIVKNLIFIAGPKINFPIGGKVTKIFLSLSNLTPYNNYGKQ